MLNQGIEECSSTLFANIRYGKRRWTVLYMHEVNNPELFRTVLDVLTRHMKWSRSKDGLESLQSENRKKPLLSLTFDDADKTVHRNCLPD